LLFRLQIEIIKLELLVQEKSLKMKENFMKNIIKNEMDDDLLPEYNFDFSKSKPNRFSQILKKQQNLVQLDVDVAKYYKTEEQVNNALRAIISAYPRARKSMSTSI
jgi:hypothetical protein